MNRLLSFIILLVLLPFNLRAVDDSNAEYVLKRAKQLNEDQEYAGSSQLIDRYLDNNPLRPTHKDSLSRLNLLQVQGANFYYLGVGTKAADLYEQALKFADALGEKAKSAAICNELFIIHLNSGNLDLSKDLLMKSLEIYKSLNDKVGECKILNNLGILAYKQNDFDSSLQYYSESLKLAGDDSYLRSIILTNLAEIYAQKDDLKEAERLLDEALALNDYGYDSSDLLQAWLSKAALLNALGNKSAARDILRNVGSKISIRESARLVDSYKQLSNIYLSMGDSVVAFRWSLKAQELTDSLHTKEENDQLREILVRYNSERIADHNKMLETNVKRQKQWTQIMVLFTILLVSLTVFLIIKLRADRRKNNLIREQREQLLEFERREHDRKESEFQEQIDRKNRELTAYSIDASSISELHKILLDSLRKLSRRVDDKALRKEIVDDISKLQNFNNKEVNEDFRVYFNEVHPDFLKRLSDLFPDLTANDLRLCSYLYLGMSTKEIASLTFREIRSVESSRLRLRKKLGISGDITLHDFLHSL